MLEGPKESASYEIMGEYSQVCKINAFSQLFVKKKSNFVKKSQLFSLYTSHDQS